MPKRKADLVLTDDLSPERLAVIAQSGSAAAFARLVTLFEARLYNFLLRRVGRVGDAEDLTQEAFLRAWERIDSYKPAWRFSTWLYTIASRLAISRARESSRRPMLRITEEESGYGVMPEPDEPPSDATRIWKLVDEVLTDEQRTAVWLRYVEDLSIAEVAAVMDKSSVAVRVMLFRARSVLAENLEPAQPDASPVITTRTRPAVTGGIP